MMILINKFVTIFCFYTELMVEFSDPSYTSSESSGNIPVTLLLRGGTSAIDITVTVTPSDRSPVSAEGKRCVCPTMTS